MQALEKPEPDPSFVHVASSQNGWQSPSSGSGGCAISLVFNKIKIRGTAARRGRGGTQLLVSERKKRTKEKGQRDDGLVRGLLVGCRRLSFAHAVQELDAHTHDRVAQHVVLPLRSRRVFREPSLQSLSSICAASRGPVPVLSSPLLSPSERLPAHGAVHPAQHHQRYIDGSSCSSKSTSMNSRSLAVL